MKILVINASHRGEKGHTHFLINKLFQGAVTAGAECEAIVLAHNQDDQVETLLLQLLRGTGVKGASAMAEYRNQDSGIRIQHDQGAGKLNPESRILNPAVIRPLLDVPRSEIAAYAKDRKSTRLNSSH